MSETVFVKLCQIIIPCEKRSCWRKNKGVFSSVSFHASMSNYGFGAWQQANLRRPCICLGTRRHIGGHGWLTRKTGAVGEQNNNNEEK